MAYNKVYKADNKVWNAQPLIDLCGGTGFKPVYAHKIVTDVLKAANGKPKPGSYGGPFIIVIDELPIPADMLREGEAQEGVVFRQQDLNADTDLKTSLNTLVVSVNALTNLNPAFIATLENRDSYNLVSDINHLKALNISKVRDGGRVVTRLAMGDHEEFDHGLELDYMPFLQEGCSYGIYATFSERVIRVSGECRMRQGSSPFPWYKPGPALRFSLDGQNCFSPPYKLKKDGFRGALMISRDTVEVQMGAIGLVFDTTDDHRCDTDILLEGEFVAPGEGLDDPLEFHPYHMFLAGRPCGHVSLLKFLSRLETSDLNFTEEFSIVAPEIFCDINKAFIACAEDPRADGVVSLKNNRHVAAKVHETLDLTYADFTCANRTGVLPVMADRVRPMQLFVGRDPDYQPEKGAVSECEVAVLPDRILVTAYRARPDKVKTNNPGRVAAMFPNNVAFDGASKFVQIKEYLAVDVVAMYPPRDNVDTRLVPLASLDPKNGKSQQ